MKPIFIVFLVLLMCPLFAQQQAPFTLRRDAGSILNPAAEFQNYFRDEFFNARINLAHRRQWIGTEDAPQTQIGNFDYYPEYKNHGFGVHIFNRKTGAIARSEVRGTFRYRLKIDRKQSLNAGLSVGVNQYRIKPAGIRFAEPGDLIRGGENLTDISPTVGFGMQYKFKNRFYAGLSAPYLLVTRYTFQNTDKALTISNISDFVSDAGVVFYLNNYESSFLQISNKTGYTPGLPLLSVFNFRYQHDDLFWIGAGINTVLTTNLEAGIIIGRYGDRRLQIGAAYDYSFQPDVVFLGNSAEVNLTWIWGAN